MGGTATVSPEMVTAPLIDPVLAIALVLHRSLQL